MSEKKANQPFPIQPLKEEIADFDLEGSGKRLP